MLNVKVKIIYRRVAILATLIFLFLSGFNAVYGRDNSAPKSSVPDFAYPVDVKKNASALLKRSLEGKKYPQAINAMIQMIVANQLISDDQVANSLKLCDSVASVIPQPYSALADLFQARILRDMYNDYRWKYNERELPAGPVPDNPAFWNRDMFADSICSLVRRAMTSLPKARISLSSVAPVLSYWKEASDAGLLLDGFMRISALYSLSSFAGDLKTDSGVIPFFRSEPLMDEYSPVSLFNSISESLYKCGVNGSVSLRVYTDCWLTMLLSERGVDMTPFVLSEYDELKSCPESAYLLYLIFKRFSGNVFSTSETDGDSYLPCDPNPPLVCFGQSFPAVNGPDSKDIFSDVMRLDSLEKKLDKGAKERISYMRKKLSEKSLSLNVRSQFLPGDSIRMRASFKNVNTGYILVYSLPFSENSDLYKNCNITNVLQTSTLVGTWKVETEGEIPFQAEKEVALPPLPPGFYGTVILPESTVSRRMLNIMMRSSQDVSTFRVSSLALAEVISPRIDGVEKERRNVIVMDGAYGLPVADADVKIWRENTYKKKGDTEKLSGRTDADGIFSFDADALLEKVVEGNSPFFPPILAEASKDGSVVFERFSGYSSNYNNFKDAVYGETRAGILTDLAIYHPGDSLNFAAVCYSVSNHRGSLLRNKGMYAELVDPSGVPMDSLRLVSDRDGRIAGRFRIPKDCLLGSWSVIVRTNPSGVLADTLLSVPSKSLFMIGSRSFEVADYKMPSFYVTARCDGMNVATSLPDTISFSGKVMTYSGMPMGGVRVKYDVTYAPFWWRSGESASYGNTVVTGPDGSYEVKLPTDGLRGTRFEYGTFSFSAVATSMAGESQKSDAVYFSVGNGRTVTPDIPDRIRVASDSVRFNVSVQDAAGLPVVCSVEYTLLNDSDEIVTEGVFTSPVLNLSSSLFPSGRYRMKFHIEGNPLECIGNGDAECRFIIWRESDTVPPIETALWVPQGRIVASNDPGTVKVPFGSSYKEGRIFCLISSSEGPVERRWLWPKGEMCYVEIAVPDSFQRTKVEFYAMRNLHSEYAEVMIIPQSQERKMNIEVMSFRDKLLPGKRENWSFRINVDSIPSSHGNAMAVLYDKALEAIKPLVWNLNPSMGRWLFIGRSDFISAHMKTWSVNWSYATWKGFEVAVPGFDTYGCSLFGYNGHIKLRGTGYYAKASANSLYIEESCYDEDDSFVVEAYGTASKEALAGAAAGVEAKDMDPVDTVSFDDGGFQDEGSVASPADLRPVEMPLAFFRPELKADGSGTVNVDFEVPDYNTTWKFRLLGYDDELHTLVLTLDAIAAKKVMVRSNPPRFLRTGDKSVVSAMLFNNSGEKISVGGHLEIVDPFSGKVLCSRKFDPEVLDPSGSRAVSMEWDVAPLLSVVLLRAYAEGAGFTDGEQSEIIILPSSSPVIEGRPFWIPEQTRDFSMLLPEFGDSVSLALQYCDNPVWYCVTSLPTLVDTEASNALSIMNSLFGGCVSMSLYDKYPRIKESIDYLSSPEGSSDPVLLSALSRNSELKSLALSLTPWSVDAAAETLAIQRLASLTDSILNASIANSLVSKLEALQQPSGGIKWSDFIDPDGFVTEHVLYWISMMRMLGCNVEKTRLTDIATKAIDYLDNWYLDSYKKLTKKHYDPLSMVSYLYIRTFFKTPDDCSFKFSKLAQKTIDALRSDWHSLSIVKKGEGAVVLSRFGDRDTSFGILESLSQYASSSPEKGIWFDQIRSVYSPFSTLQQTASVLRAFSEIAPSSPMIDGLRQWLVLSRQTENWSLDPSMALVIASILESGADWTVSSKTPEISVGGNKISMNEGSRLTGEITVSLDPKKVSGKTLHIKRDAPGPAWGGVVSREILPMNEVEEYSIPQLSVTKTLYVITEGSDGRNATEGDLKVGDKVRVTLMVHTDRDMQYVTLTDERAACLEPVQQLSGYTSNDGVWYDRQTRQSTTDLLIPFLPKGDFVLNYECYVDRPGDYSIGIATVQSQYAPVFVAHSAGDIISVRE